MPLQPKSNASTPNPKPSSSTPNPKPKSTSKPSQSQIHGGGGEDRLSSLPDPILHQILSLLPTDDMVRTSALARRWAHLWTFSPVLHFTRNFTKSSDFDDFLSIVDIVDRCLSQCAHSQKILSLRFPLEKFQAFSLTADRWIRFAAAHSVEHLTFSPMFMGKFRVDSCLSQCDASSKFSSIRAKSRTFSLTTDRWIRLFAEHLTFTLLTCTPKSLAKFWVDMPPSLFNCGTLASLNLNSFSIYAVPAESCGFPLLTVIAFTHVTIGDHGLEALLKLCPRIESLSLMVVHGITRLVVRSPAMRHLMVYKCTGLDRVEIVEAPELRRLMYCGDLLKFANLDKGIVPKLEEAVLLSSAKDPFEGQEGMWEGFVAAIAHVRVLSVNSWLFQYTLGGRFSFGDQPDVFHNLKELHWWPGVVDMPDYHCTYYLELDKSAYGYLSDSFDDELYGEEFTLQEFEGVGYELPCLKMVRIIEFSGRKEEKLLLEFLAGKAAVLESMCLHYVGEIEEEIDEIQREIHAFYKASPHVEVSFVEFNEDKVCPKHEDMFFSYMVV